MTTSHTVIYSLPSAMSFPAADISEIVSQFSTNRPLLPPMFIATPHDRGSSHWTTPTPNLVSIRLQLLARESLTLLSQQLLQHNLRDMDIRVSANEYCYVREEVSINSRFSVHTLPKHWLSQIVNVQTI